MSDLGPACAACADSRPCIDHGTPSQSQSIITLSKRVDDLELVVVVGDSERLDDALKRIEALEEILNYPRPTKTEAYYSSAYAGTKT